MGISRTQIRWNGWGWAGLPDLLEKREEIWRWLARETGMPALLATPARALEDIALPAPRLAADLIRQFSDSLGTDRVRTDDYQRAFHARGRFYPDLLRLRAGDLASAPDVVLYPRGEDEVRAILIFAAAKGIGVVPFGGGCGIEIPAAWGGPTICLDLSGMDRVIGIDADTGIATFEAGITGPALENALAASGLTLGHFPESFEFSTLGGWIAGGGGEGWLQDLRLATAHGVLDSAAAPGLGHIVRGSKGALGVVTQASLRAHPITRAHDRAFLFRDFAGGVAAIRQAQRPHLVLELYDAGETAMRRSFARLEEPAGPLSGLRARLGDAWIAAQLFDAGAAMLVASFATAKALREFTALAKKRGALDLGEGPVRTWRRNRFRTRYRRDALMERGLGLETLEASVHWAALPALHAATRQALDNAMREHAPSPGAHGLVTARIVKARPEGTEICFTVLFARLLENENGQWQAIQRAGAEAILAQGGTPGRGFGDGVPPNGALALAVLRGLKNTLDPENILRTGRDLAR